MQQTLQITSSLTETVVTLRSPLVWEAKLVEDVSAMLAVHCPVQSGVFVTINYLHSGMLQ